MAPNTVKALDLPPLTPSAADRVATVGERLDLVEHVNVKLSVTLGSAEMSISDLFGLAPGGVIPLDREADAPVDVRLNGALIARGILVAAGDRFGVRLTEIIDAGK
jgi:flagellar motor switch protein FliN/FliY